MIAMASACVNNIGVSPESFPPAKFPAYGWLSPRISLSRDDDNNNNNVLKSSATNKPKNQALSSDSNADAENPDPDTPTLDFVDFEFRLEDPVAMLPADELFADGKLVPLHLSSTRHSAASADARSPDTPKFRRRNEVCPNDPYLFSPKAPRCSSRWKELLGLKKLYQNSNAKHQEDMKVVQNNKSAAARSLKHFLHRNSKTSSLNASVDSSMSLPLLKDSDNESVSVSSRLSLSSSSSGHEHDDLPRLSLDSDKPSSTTVSRNAHQPSSRNLTKVRLVKHRAGLENAARAGRSPMKRAPETAAPVRGVSVDSPRMNSSGKIVFHSLERSSSSPSTLNGAPRYKHRGMERSYSANVRVTPVLNVPVCSLRGSSKSGVFGFPLFSTQQKKENGGGGNAGSRTQHNHPSKNRMERTVEKKRDQ